MEKEELSSINEYFKHLAHITRNMDREQMTALWKQVKRGNKAAKDQIMESNLRLVIPTAKRFLRPGMDLMDLIEEGNLGLMQAIEKFDPAKGYRFSTYAVYWIEQYIRKYIEEQSGSIKIPSHAWGNLKRWFKAWNNLKDENGRDPSLREMAQELDLTARQVKAIMDTLSAATGVESLTSLVGEEDEMTLEEVLSDDGKGNPHEVFLRSENMQVLQQSLLNLPEREREILSLRFGLTDNEPKTLGEVSDKMGLSRERVRQLEERALKQLRTDAQKAGLVEFVQQDHRTRKLHAGMVLDKQKTNILGEIVVGGSLGRLLRRRAAMQSPSQTAKTAATAQKTKTVQKTKPRSQKTQQRKAVVSKIASNKSKKSKTAGRKK